MENPLNSMRFAGSVTGVSPRVVAQAASRETIEAKMTCIDL